MAKYGQDVSRSRSAPGRAGGAGRALFAASAIMALVLSACGDDDDDTGVASAADAGGESLAGTSWILDSYVVESDDVAAVGVAALDFGADGKTLNGSTGCNNFGGEYLQDGSGLDISLGATTLAACTDDVASNQEQAILELLPQVVSFTSGAQLTLQDDSGATLLLYNPGTAGLEGTSWTATGVNNGTGGVEASALTETVTAVFGPDGALSGFSGCNEYTAQYETSGTDGLTITAVTTTMKACDEAASTLEAQYTAGLEKVTNYDISGATLTLRDSGGAAQATFTIDN